MISGIEFYKECKWNICNRYPVNFDLNHISDGDFVFVNLDAIYTIINYLDKSNFTKRINLVTHNSDISFNQDMLDRLRRYVVRIYPINSIVSDEIIKKIPLGFSDRLISVISVMDIPNDKSNLIYLNFNQTRNNERRECLDFFKPFNWVTYENEISEKDYYISLSKSKYSICPTGTGIDTHRFYESIYFKTIPIVKRNQLSDLHEIFPCIIVDNWSEIDYDFLINNYDILFNRLSSWVDSNKWSSVDYWIKDLK
jgi:hypothetical protein